MVRNVLMFFVALGLVTTPEIWAQEGTAAPAKADTSAAPSEANPGGGEGSSDAEQAARRRRFVTTTTAQAKVGDKTISLVAGILKTGSPDYETIGKLKDGEVLLLTRSQVFKLKTDLPLTFGNVTLKTENVAAGYAGVYGIWMKKTSDGWHFIFNQKPDMWGTMYDPAADVAEIPVTYSKLDEPTKALKFEIPEKDNAGELKISWGEHQWVAPFTLAQ